MTTVTDPNAADRSLSCAPPLGYVGGITNGNPRVVAAARPIRHVILVRNPL